jgi:O-antigen/teichoic acid export membrane protein
VIIKKAITHRSAIKKWTGKGFWAIMDQGLVATSNFILNILLARWLSITEYGTFCVAYTIFLLIATFHTATLSEPMLVFGPGKYKKKIKAYLRVLLLGQWIFGLTVGTIFLFAYLVLWSFTSSPQAPVFFGLAIASPFILFQWLMRRACYIILHPQLAAIAGAGYMVLTLFGAFCLYSLKWLSPTTALFVMAIASLLSGLWLFFKIKVYYNYRKDSELIIDVLNDHWRYGRWASGTAALSWIPGNIFTLFLPIWWGLEASAAYKALLNLLLPMMHVTTALGAIFLPVLVDRRSLPNFRYFVLLFSIFIIFATVIYWLLLGAFSELIIRFLYSGKYLEYVDLLWLTGVIPIMVGLITISGDALQAMERPDKVFLAYVASSGVTLTVGLLFVLSSGVSGAMVGSLLAYIVTGSVMTGMLASCQKPSALKIDIAGKNQF